jgi:hypothetical protein
VENFLRTVSLNIIIKKMRVEIIKKSVQSNSILNKIMLYRYKEEMIEQKKYIAIVRASNCGEHLKKSVTKCDNSLTMGIKIIKKKVFESLIMLHKDLKL